MLRIRVAAPAVDGKANAALIAFVSKALGVRISDITVINGHASRQKLVEVAGVSQEEAEQKLREKA